MTLNRNIFEQTRPYLLASLTSAAMCSMTVVAQAQQASPDRPHSGYAAPQLMPMVNQNARPLETTGQAVTLAAGQVPAPGQYPAQDLSQMEQSEEFDSARGKRSTPILDRIGKIFRKDHGSGPPVDPGMSYPTASAGSPPPAPAASQSAIPAIPPRFNANNQPQPALFQPAISANPIDQQAQTAANVSSGNTSQQLAPVGGTQELPMKKIPELRELMVGGVEVPTPEESVQVPPPEVASSRTLPTLDFNAPIPGPAPQIAPGEPSEPLTVQITPAPAPAPAVAAPAEKSADPFDNLFPADAKKTAQAAPTPETSETVTQPYTGLTLDMNNSKSPVETLPSPNATPELPAISAASTEDLKPIPAAPPIQTAAAVPEQKMTNPSLPPQPDLSVSRDLPKLSKTEAPPLTIQQTRAAQPQIPTSQENDPRSKLERIASRSNLSGLKGFCPVVLRDERDLRDARPEFSVVYNGHDYALSSLEAKEKFLAEPAKYAPAAGCCDVIHLALTGERVEGSLEHAVWYKGRLYLFNGVETMETFVAAPSSHATDE